MAASISAYEEQRDKNIEANNAMLRSLGLLVENKKDDCTIVPTVPKRKKEENVAVLPSRKSARLNNVPTYHQEVYLSSDEDDDNSSRKRSRKKAKDAPSKDFVSIRQSNRRSQKILPEVIVDDEDSDDDFDNTVFYVTDIHAADAADATDATDERVFSSFDFDPYGFDTSTSAKDVIRFPMPTDRATAPDETADDPYSRPVFVSTMFFMDSDTVLCPQV